MIRSSASAGRGTVTVLAPDGTTSQRTTGTGLSSDTTTQVTSGLSVGELVVLPESNTPNAVARVAAGQSAAAGVLRAAGEHRGAGAAPPSPTANNA